MATKNKNKIRKQNQKEHENWSKLSVPLLIAASSLQSYIATSSIFHLQVSNTVVCPLPCLHTYFKKIFVIPAINAKIRRR